LPVRAIFVVNQSGEYVDENFSSRGVSNEADLEHLKRQRAWAKCIVTTGATARAESYAPLQNKRLVVLTRLSSAAFPLLAGSPGVEFRSYKEQSTLSGLVERYEKVLVEFGPDLLNQALRNQEIDALQLSVTGDYPLISKELVNLAPLDLSKYAIEETEHHPSLALATCRPTSRRIE
jgi:riboflavin biosynthesis pyrimidine reductase